MNVPATGPLIWGQRAFWEVLRWLPEGDVSTNLACVLPVPAGTTVDRVNDVLCQIVERHDSLRTTVVERDGEVTQTVAWHADVRAELVEPADAITERLARVPFDPATGPALRAALVVRDGEPAELVLSFSHMAVDGSSFAIVCRELEQLLQGSTPLSPRAQQPLERAAYERSAPARRRAERALTYWRDRVRTLPRAMLERSPADAESRWATMSSPALAFAVATLAARNRISASTVTQALIGLALGSRLGLREVGLRSIVATRFRPETRELVAPFNQNALLCLDLDVQPVSRFLAAAGAAVMVAYRACEYPPERLEPIIEEVCAERGFPGGSYCFFNDVRHGEAAENRPPADADVSALRDRTKLAELDVPDRQKGAKFFFYLNELSETARVTLCADPRFLGCSPSEFLSSLELLACAALDEDPAVVTADPRSSP